MWKAVKLIGIQLGVLAVILFVTSFHHGGETQIVDNGTPLLARYGVVKIVGAIILSLLGLVVFNVGRQRENKTALEAQEDDQRKPVVYLRSFGIDKQKTQLSYSAEWSHALSHRTDEEELIELFSPVGPVIAIGDPRDKRCPIGIPRYYVKQWQNLIIASQQLDFELEPWKSQIQQLISSATLIFIAYEESDGLFWEINHVLENKQPGQVLFLFEDRQLWDSFRQNFVQPFGKDLPSTSVPVRYLGFSDDGVPKTLVTQVEMLTVEEFAVSDFGHSQPELKNLERFISERRVRRPNWLTRFFKKRFVNMGG